MQTCTTQEKLLRYKSKGTSEQTAWGQSCDDMGAVLTEALNTFSKQDFVPDLVTILNFQINIGVQWKIITRGIMSLNTVSKAKGMIV